jgi:hypothetical protein
VLAAKPARWFLDGPVNEADSQQLAVWLNVAEFPLSVPGLDLEAWDTSLLPGMQLPNMLES